MDSENILDAFLGKSSKGRSVLVEQGGALSIVKDGWKYITPNNGPTNTGPKLTNVETGNLPTPQLYNLKEDIGEKNNLADKYPEKVKEMETLLEKFKLKKSE
jgi:arylsulfatase A-like enzyme